MGKTATPLQKTPVQKKRVADRIEREYRLYRIVAGDLGERCKAIAYLGMGNIAPVDPVEASSVDEAVAQMEAALEARLVEMRQDRRDGVPTVTEFREAIAALPAAIREDIRSLQIEKLDPQSPQPALEAMSMRTQVQIVTILDRLRKAARKLADLLDAKPEGPAKDAEPLSLLGVIENTDAKTAPALAFHPEFGEALASLPPERQVAVVRRR
ncbi:hypothetical protein [Hoeflea sp.]|uniref:hypothetical protein n=1 Tax=Hoeflea sp. TaxID=1940281 RepID=UPI0019A6D22B|nr:hypothetical protein [Hoeflea sp.]MBC7284331.1 hypothetical protein [Hoeflea sp.]